MTRAIYYAGITGSVMYLFGWGAGIVSLFAALVIERTLSLVEF